MAWNPASEWSARASAEAFYEVEGRDLRVYARPARFSSELSAAACAAATEALRATIAEPEHRARLWANRQSLDRALRGAGFDLPAPESPILSIGNDRLTGLLARKLLQLGIRVRALVHPAAPQGEGSLRLRVSATHTPLEIETAASILGRLGRTHGLLQREVPPRSAGCAAKERAPEQSLHKP